MSRRAVAAFFVLGTLFVVAGGLLSAADQQLGWERGSWLVAYLVLVCGVAQAAIGPAQRHFAVEPVTDARAWWQLACWNAGNVLVIVGSLTTTPPVVDVGGAVLLVTLVLSLLAVRRGRVSGLLWAYRILLAVLVVSIPVGLVLAHLRSG